MKPSRSSFRAFLDAAARTSPKASMPHCSTVRTRCEQSPTVDQTSRLPILQAQGALASSPLSDYVDNPEDFFDSPAQRALLEAPALKAAELDTSSPLANSGIIGAAEQGEDVSGRNEDNFDAATILDRIKQRLAELRSEQEQHKPQVCALIAKIRERKAMLKAVNEFTEYCENQGIEWIDALDKDVDEDFVELANWILGAGCAASAQAEEAKIRG